MNEDLVGKLITKNLGDYRFDGEVIGYFKKKSGKELIAAENQDGIVHIFRPGQVVVEDE